jgi:TorA maturation chaperone TorD
MCVEASMPTPSESETTSAQIDGDPAFHLCRATLYSALGLGFLAPTHETIARLCTSSAIEALADAAAVVGRVPPFDAVGACGIFSASRAPAEAEPPWFWLERLSDSHRRLFGHTAKGEVPPYETEYGDEALFQQPQELADLAGFMHAFGLRLRPELHERIDHVSCECEFLSFLACKEAYAWTRGDRDMGAAASHATRIFLRDHLGRFAPAFARRVLRAQPHAFHESLAQSLLALVTADCRRLGVPLASAGLGLRPDPATCAAPSGCSTGEARDCGTAAEAP